VKRRLVETWSALTYRRRLALISVTGLLGRLIYVPFERPLRIWSDEHWYITQAHRLFEGHPWSSIFDYSIPTASHGPLVSIFMSPFAALSPIDPTATAHDATMAMAGLRYVVPFIGFLSILGIATVVRQIAGERAALIAASLAVIYPGLWIRDGLVVSEPFAIAAFVWLLATLLRWRRNPSWRLTLAVGLLVGAVALSRAEMLALAVVVIAVVWWHDRSRVRLWRPIAAVAIAALTCVPWVAYNANRFEKPVYLSTNLGITLAGANCHLAYYDGRYLGYDDMACWADAAAAHPSPDESVRSSEMAHDAWQYAKAHMSRWPIVVAAREAWFFGLYRPDWVVFMSLGSGQRAWATWAQAVGGYILFPVFLWAMWRRRGTTSDVERLARRLIVVTAAFSVTLAAVFVGHWRYRLGLDVVALIAVSLWLAGSSAQDETGIA
jgi:4-amino-4-deoxy-L-arabinose transferase-like glycosyltransferase